MQRARSAPSAAAAATSTGVSGVERDPDAETELTGACDRLPRLGAHLHVEGHAVAARLRYRLEVLLGLLDHEMAVEPPTPAAHERGDRREHHRADGDLRDEVAVPHVEVEHPSAGGLQRLELVAETREVGRVDRRLDLDRACPLGPARRLTSTTPAALANRRDPPRSHPLPAGPK